MKTLDDYKTFLAGVRRQTGLEALTADAPKDESRRTAREAERPVTFRRAACKICRRGRINSN